MRKEKKTKYYSTFPALWLVWRRKSPTHNLSVNLYANRTYCVSSALYGHVTETARVLSRANWFGSGHEWQEALSADISDNLSVISDRDLIGERWNLWLFFYRIDSGFNHVVPSEERLPFTRNLLKHFKKIPNKEGVRKLSMFRLLFSSKLNQFFSFKLLICVPRWKSINWCLSYIE